MQPAERGPRDLHAVVSRFVEACTADERIVAAMLTGSYANIVRFFRERAPGVAGAYGLTYPTELERLMRGRLDDLVRASR